MLDVPSVDVSKLIAPFVLAYYPTNTENLRSSAAKYDKVSIFHLFSKAPYVRNLASKTILTHSGFTRGPYTKIAGATEDHILSQTKVCIVTVSVARCLLPNGGLRDIQSASSAYPRQRIPHKHIDHPCATEAGMHEYHAFRLFPDLADDRSLFPALGVSYCFESSVHRFGRDDR